MFYEVYWSHSKEGRGQYLAALKYKSDLRSLSSLYDIEFSENTQYRRNLIRQQCIVDMHDELKRPRRQYNPYIDIGRLNNLLIL